MSPSTAIRILSIEHNADDVVHLAHPDDKGADEVEVGFFASLAGHLVLGFGIVARDFGDWAEEEI